MTTRNNFDTSSTGVNIECSVFYDLDRARMDFDENFKILQHSSYRTSSVLYYIDNGNVREVVMPFVIHLYAVMYCLFLMALLSGLI